MEIKKLTSLIMEPTNTCNLRCTFCYVTEGMARPEGFMDLDLFRKVVNDTPDLEHLCMHNWGEPLLHKQIFEMFDHAHKAGVPWIVMNTNGTLLSPKMIKKLSTARCPSFDFLSMAQQKLSSAYAAWNWKKSSAIS